VPVLGSCQAMDVIHLLAEMDVKEEKWPALMDEGGVNEDHFLTSIRKSVHRLYHK